MNIVETIHGKNNHVIEIIQDENPESPRDWDNLGTMACFHRRYKLGDTHSLDIEDVTAIAKSDQYLSLPLYLYDHSGITMNTCGFSCPWDSGQVGIIFVSKDRIRKEYGWKNITGARAQKIYTYLNNEVKIYDMFLTGQVYGFVVKDNKDNVIDSCWGFYGDDIKTNGVIDHIDGYLAITPAI